MAMFPRISLREIQKVEELQRRAHWATYKGLCRGQAVAILELQQVVRPEEEEAYNALFNMMCEYHNPHLVLFLGVCTEGAKWMVITEYLANGSLSDFIDSSSQRLANPPTSSAQTRNRLNSGGSPSAPTNLSLDRKLCFAIDMCQGLSWLFRSSSVDANLSVHQACFPFLMHHHMNAASYSTGLLSPSGSHESIDSKSERRGGSTVDRERGAGGLKGTAMLIDNDGKCKFNFGVCLIKAKLASLNASQSTSLYHSSQFEANNTEPSTTDTPNPIPINATTTTSRTFPHSLNEPHGGHHGEKEVVFCFGKIFCELLTMKRVTAYADEEVRQTNSNSSTITNTNSNTITNSIDPIRSVRPHEDETENEITIDNDIPSANTSTHQTSEQLDHPAHVPSETEQWLRRRITFALANVHSVLADVISRCSGQNRSARPSFTELISILQVARVDISLPHSLSPVANQIWKQDEFLSTRKVKLSELVASIYKLLALKDQHATGSYALSQRQDITLLTALLTEKGQMTGKPSSTASPSGASASHSPTKTGSPMKFNQREVLLTLGTMANLIGWFGPLDAHFFDKVSGLMKQRWFFGMLEGEEAHVHLQRGQFLVRMNLGANISIEKSPYTLSSLDEHGQLLHTRIYAPCAKRKVSHPFSVSSSMTDSNGNDLAVNDGEKRVMAMLQQTHQSQQHPQNISNSNTIEGPRDITAFIQYLISIDYLKEANITTSDTPYARLFKNANSTKKHSPYEVADGEEESDEDEEKGKFNQNVSHGNRLSGTRTGAKEQDDVLDLDFNEWIRISGGKKTPRTASHTPHARTNSDRDSGTANISSSTSASDGGNKLSESWIIL